MRLLATIVILMMTFHAHMWGQDTWVKTFGGSGDDGGISIISTPDGGYILTGYTQSDDGDFKDMNKGKSDIIVTKLNVHGEVQWKKTFGGSETDLGYTIVTTPDGHIVLTGETYSNDGDFKGMNKGGYDIFVIKLDSLGSVQWKKTFGGSEIDLGYIMVTTPDGGFVLTGETNSNDGDFNGMNKGKGDIFVIKLDSLGGVQWKKTFGGSSYDNGHTIATTPDGGYIVTGRTSSNDGDFKGMNKGDKDIFVIKLDSLGNVQWNKTFGGSEMDLGNIIVTTPDGGYVLTGVTNSNDGDFKGMNKVGNNIFVFIEFDIFVIKLDSLGSVQWKKTFGGSSYDNGHTITTTPDGGYVLTGVTASNNGDFKGMNKGKEDIFGIKLDLRGSVQSKKMYGGSSNDDVHTITTTPDGGYVLTGTTFSNDGDFKGMNKGEKDVFIIKLDSNGNLQTKSTKSKKK